MHELLGLMKLKRLNHKRVKGAVDGRGRTDADRERQYRDEGEAACLRQRAKRKPKILEHVSKENPRAARKLHRAKSGTRPKARRAIFCQCSPKAMPAPSLPFDPSQFPRVKLVSSFNELVTTRFSGEINALCWPRALAGDFEEVVQKISATEDIETLDEALLRSLPLSAAGKAAVDTLIADQRGLLELGLSPVLECIRRYPTEENPGIVPIDVYSFHADSATTEADTFLCSYTESSSEGVLNEDAVCCIDIPETRARLLEEFGGEDDASFREYLHDHCYDLHYDARPGAKRYTFGLHNFWRIAVDYPGNPVLPCVHRAPDTVSGRPPRLLLIS